MLFKDEKREVVKLKAKQGIVDLASKVYETAYPFSSEANLDDLFEEMVTRYALQMGLIEPPQRMMPSAFTQESVEDLGVPEQIEQEEIENAGNMEVGNLLGA